MTTRTELIGGRTCTRENKAPAARPFLGKLRNWISKYVVWDEDALAKDPYWPRMWVRREEK